MDIDEIRNIIAEELVKISNTHRRGEGYEKLVDKIIFLVETGLEKEDNEL